MSDAFPTQQTHGFLLHEAVAGDLTLIADGHNLRHGFARGARPLLFKAEQPQLCVQTVASPDAATSSCTCLPCGDADGSKDQSLKVCWHH